MSDDPPKLTSEEIAAAALNEQGFLLQQVLREKLTNKIQGDGDNQSTWTYVANEYAVTAEDGSQTRIDLVLQHGHGSKIFLCVECKRAHPDYKRWLFFDRSAGMRDKPDLVI